MSKYAHINSRAADELVAEAAARGVLPIIDQNNRYIFGLKQRQRCTQGNTWAAWWSNSNARNGNSGITNPATTFYIATTNLAHDCQPWPFGWSLEMWLGVTPGQESRVLAGIHNRAAGIAANPKIEQIGPDVGRFKPMSVRCTKCGKEGTIFPGNAIKGTGLSCCFGNGKSVEELAKSSRTIARRRAISINTDLVSRGIHRACDPDDYVNIRTPIWFSCDCQEGGHVQSPSAALAGKKPCQSARRQSMANGKVSYAEMITACQANPHAVRAQSRGARMGGLITGAPHDSARAVLNGDLHPSESAPTCLYLHTIPDHPGLHVFGITNDPSGTPQHGSWYGDLIDTVWFNKRSDVVLVEGYFKDPETGWVVNTPPTLAGVEGASEITYAEPEDFFSCAVDLKNQLNKLGQRAFAEEYLPGTYAGAVK